MEYRIAKGACVDRVADETVVTLPTGDVVVLNAAAAVVFGAVVSGGADLDEAASLLARRYDVKIDRARRDARICIARLRGEGVIEPKRRTLAHTRVEAPVLSRRHFLGGTLSAAAFAAISAGNAFADSDGARFGYWENSSVVDRRRIWHDSRGFSVSLPEKIKKVAPVGSFAHSVMESIDPSMIVRATNWGMRASVASDAEEAGSELGESSGACLCGFVLEAEEADIVLSIVPADSPLASNEMAARNDAGVPIVHMVAGANDLPDLYEALADLLENEHAREIGEYLADLLRLLDWSKFSMAQESRKSAYVGMGDSGLNTRGSNTVLSAALDSAGALNAARDMRGAVVGLSAADVAATSPDLAIVCPSGASFNRTLSAEALAMWFDGGELSGLCPVLLEPLTPYGWLDRSPLVIYTIGALWVAAALYRDDCDFDIGVVASEYWDYLFGVDISSDDVLATLEASDLSSLPSSLFAETDSSIEDDDCGESYDSPDIEVISAGSIASARSFMGSGGGGGGGATGGGGGSSSGESSGGGDGDSAAPKEYEASFEQAFQIHFGFDSEISHLLSCVLSGIEDICPKSMDNMRLYAAYIFFRILGGFRYGNPDDGGGKDIAWNVVAGDVGSVCGSLSPSEDAPAAFDETEFFTTKLGLSTLQYKKLRYNCMLQHDLCGLEFSDDKINDEANISKNKEVYEAACDTALDTESFRGIWAEYVGQMCIMPDFCHFCITTATHLATKLGLAPVGDLGVAAAFSSTVEAIGGIAATREAFAGWLGDATFIENGKTSFGWDDYWADIDALRIANILPSNSYDVRKTFASYYSRSDTFPRRKHFTTHFSADVAARAIATTLADDTILTAAELVDVLEKDEQRQDTLRFIKAIQGIVGEAVYHMEGANK